MNLESLEKKYADLRQYLESKALLIEIEEVDRDWLADRMSRVEVVLSEYGEKQETIDWILEQAWLTIVLGVRRKY